MLQQILKVFSIRSLNPFLSFLLGSILPVFLCLVALSPKDVLAESNLDGVNPKSVRARDLGITIGRFSPGPFNAITDVAGVKVGRGGSFFREILGA